ncbi:MAG TPA: hypothetical protein VG738_15530 [Chitinophagaceae bacterium]|nr:hypothetical protein [Chitinophagaceae bacterium]
MLPTLHDSYSGSNTIITLTGGSANRFTVGGYYSQIMYGTFHSCPAGSTTTIPTLSGGTFRVTAWCGSCQNAPSSIVSGHIPFRYHFKKTCNNPLAGLI